MKILVIEDEQGARNSIRRTLETKGHEVITAANGRIGLEQIQDQAFDLVITDIFMPEMEGLETIKRIAKSKPGLPIIVMTGSVDDPYLNVGVQFGAVCGLYKPFTPEQLISAVNEASKK